MIHDRLCGASILISYLPTALCRDCARLGERKYRSVARMIFFHPTSPKGRLAQSLRHGAIFAGKKLKYDSYKWGEVKTEMNYVYLQQVQNMKIRAKR